MYVYPGIALDSIRRDLQNLMAAPDQGFQASSGQPSQPQGRPWENVGQNQGAAPTAFRLSDIRQELLSPNKNNNPSNYSQHAHSGGAWQHEDYTADALGALDQGDSEYDNSQSQSQRSSQPSSQHTSHSQPRNSNTRDELAQLLEEREDLISTGVYGSSHPIIAEMDKQIQTLRVAPH